MAIFISLFMAADSNFSAFIRGLFTLNFELTLRHVLLIPINLYLFLLIFIYSFSNIKEREVLHTNKHLDPLVIGIFLGMLNLLFIIFLVFQLNYLFGGEKFIREMGINIATYAREGFFQLMWVMGIILVIFLWIMRHFQGEKSIAFLLSGLIISTMIIGFASLKKMYLYQSIKGATVLRYYVEWFDYFLLLVLGLGILFILKRIHFSKLLNTVTITALIALTIVSSINIDNIVATHNIEKFKNTPQLLDKKAISKLSIDALQAIQNTNIVLEIYVYNGHERSCDEMKQYHYGYCSLIEKYGAKQIAFVNNYVGVLKETTKLNFEK